ncbi:hypothetical protein [Eupransor demetentiae]
MDSFDLALELGKQHSIDIMPKTIDIYRQGKFIAPQQVRVFAETLGVTPKQLLGEREYKQWFANYHG